MRLLFRREGIFAKNSFFFSFILSAIIFLMTFLSRWIAPDHSPNADRIQNNLSLLPPFSQFEIINSISGQTVETSEKFQIPLIVKSYQLENDSIYFASDRLPDEDNLVLPSSDYKIEKYYSILGTDRSGRDIFSRVLVGGKISLSIGLFSVLVSCLIGTVLGLISGYFGGTTDKIVSWLINVFWAFPSILLAMVFTLTFGKSLASLIFAIGLGIWVDTARVIRGEAMRYKKALFIEATQALGFNHFRVLFFHVLPNCIGSLIVVSISNFASAILIESGLSFLGQGVQPPIPSWGGMIFENKQFLFTEHYFTVLIPAIFLTIIVLCFTFMGNNLRDYFDAKAKS